MNSSRSSRHRTPMDLGKVLEAAALGLATALLVGMGFVIGYQAEKQASR